MTIISHITHLIHYVVTFSYLGIPFAAPPVGDLRFYSPVQPKPWTKVLSVMEHGEICPQYVDDGIWLGHEDCLYLNVIQPDDIKEDEKLPVIVWIYGGAFVFGDGYEFGLYSGFNLVKQHRVIIVTFNYRLGALGFMALDELSKTDPLHMTGNQGMADQLFALQWVHDNIENFGGNSSHVTLAGESAGAMSVCFHLASPASQGLFHAALMESGTCDSPVFFVDREPSVEWSIVYGQSIGCNYTDSHELVECLQLLPASIFVAPEKANQTVNQSIKRTMPTSIVHGTSVTPPALPLLYPTIPWAPTIDGVLLHDTPLAIMKSGKAARVPLLIGTNLDEGSIFLNQLYQILPGELHNPFIYSDIPLILAHMFANNSTIINAVLQQYPADNFKSITNLTETLLRDNFFLCPSRRALKMLSNLPNPVDTFFYQYNYLSDFIEDHYLGVYHSSELEFVWDNEFPPIIHSFSKKDQYVADMMGSYWTNYAKSFSPNIGGKTPIFWPAWNNSTKLNLQIDSRPIIDKDLQGDICDFWDMIAEEQPQQIRPSELLNRLDKRNVDATKSMFRSE